MTHPPVGLAGCPHLNSGGVGRNSLALPCGRATVRIGLVQKCGFGRGGPGCMADMALDGPIGDRIRIYRGRRGLSQRELAGLIGRSESWLSQVERGVRTVDRFSVLVDIAQVLKTNVQTLAGTRLEYAPNGDEQ